MSLSAAEKQDEEKALLPKRSTGRWDDWEGYSGTGGGSDTDKEVPSRAHEDRLGTITLVLMLSMSVVSSVVGAALLAQAKSNQMVVDFASNLCDAVAYTASIFASFYVRDKSQEKKDSVEFWTAVFSTMLLYAVGAKIGFECYEQMQCAMDTQNHVDGTLRCSFWLERPEPKVVLFIEFFKLCLYVALTFLFSRGQYLVVIRKNINLSSAMLHAVVDFMQGVVFGVASLMILNTKKTERKVTIDAIASIFALLVLLFSTVHLWKEQFFSGGRH